MPRLHADSNAVSYDDQVKAYIKKIMSQLNKWMVGGKISKLVVVITSKETGEPVERWEFDVLTFLCHEACAISLPASQVHIFSKAAKSKSAKKTTDKENAAPESVHPPAYPTLMYCFFGHTEKRL